MVKKRLLFLLCLLLVSTLVSSDDDGENLEYFENNQENQEDPNGDEIVIEDEIIDGDGGEGDQGEGEVLNEEVGGEDAGEEGGGDEAEGEGEVSPPEGEGEMPEGEGEMPPPEPECEDPTPEPEYEDPTPEPTPECEETTPEPTPECEDEEEELPPCYDAPPCHGHSVRNMDSCQCECNMESAQCNFPGFYFEEDECDCVPIPAVEDEIVKITKKRRKKIFKDHQHVTLPQFIECEETDFIKDARRSCIESPPVGFLFEECEFVIQNEECSWALKCAKTVTEDPNSYNQEGDPNDPNNPENPQDPNNPEVTEPDSGESESAEECEPKKKIKFENCFLKIKGIIKKKKPKRCSEMEEEGEDYNKYDDENHNHDDEE